ncbi:hypothetical protein, partial [Akkermansia sp.]
HAYQECERPGKTGCREMVKREIVAYKYDGRCKVLHNTIPNFDECVKKGATRSAAPSCGGETSARKVVDEIYPQIKI